MTATIIASLPEARAALVAAQSSGVAAELESPPNAASIYGVLWFAALNRALLAEFPRLSFTLSLDCGNRADLAHAALVEGINRIRFSGHPEAARALQDIAAQLKAELIAQPPSELLYVIAAPDISPADRAWIQSIRAQHDPQCDLVGPHFTLVFGTDRVPAVDLLARTQAIAGRMSEFEFETRNAQVFAGASAEHYVFLVPEKGAAELRALHAALGVESTPDIPFVPHITIGRLADAEAAAMLVDRLNADPRTIRGRVAALKIIAVANRTVREHASVAFGGN
jgi:2'-5' RNA ligase